MYFDLYLPYAVKISDSGNMSVVSNPYWVNSKETAKKFVEAWKLPKL